MKMLDWVEKISQTQFNPIHTHPYVHGPIVAFINAIIGPFEIFLIIKKKKNQKAQPKKKIN